MQTTISTPLTQGNKLHFEVLDGLRGTASIAIVVFHFCELIWTDYSKNPMGHGFLAVDFFFCLSGFVIGYAYDDRIQKIGNRAFFTARLIRLHPLVVLGSVLGLLSFLFDPFSIDPYAKGMMLILLSFLCSLFLLPMPGLPERAGALFPLNSPAWSLFMEYLANIFYAFVLSRVHRMATLLLAIAAAIWLGFTAYHANTLIGGWADVNALDGVARVSYSFLAGLAVYRFGWIWKTHTGYILLSILLVLTFVFPYFSWNWAAEYVTVLLIYPMIVALGAGATVQGRVRRFCIFTGRLSYPLYMTHIAAIWPFGNYYTKYHPTGWLLFGIVVIGTLVLLLFAWLVMRYFDEPVRAWLQQKKAAREKSRIPAPSHTKPTF